VHAYLDESARHSGAGLYVVAAALVPDDEAADVREAMRGLLAPRQVRFHWNKEHASARWRAVETVAALGLRIVAVATSPLDHRKTERARRHCLLRLLWEVGQRGVVAVTFESRQKHDTSDRQVIAAGQRAGVVSPGLRYDFGLPRSEPLLWLPDIAAGAVARSSADADTTYVDLLGESLSLVHLA